MTMLVIMNSPIEFDEKLTMIFSVRRKEKPTDETSDCDGFSKDESGDVSFTESTCVGNAKERKRFNCK